MTKQLNEIITNLETKIAELEKDIVKEESKIGYKTESSTKGLQQIRRKKQKLDIIKELASRSVELGIDNMNNLILTLFFRNFFNEDLEQGNTQWIDLIQESILISKRFKKEDFQNRNILKEVIQEKKQ